GNITISVPINIFKTPYSYYFSFSGIFVIAISYISPLYKNILCISKYKIFIHIFKSRDNLLFAIPKTGSFITKKFTYRMSNLVSDNGAPIKTPAFQIKIISSVGHFGYFIAISRK